jgi:DNA-binding MarR family transcriptional regulator
MEKPLPNTTKAPNLKNPMPQSGLSSFPRQASRPSSQREARALKSPAVDLSFLQASLGFNVRLLDVRLMKMFAASLTKFEVTPAEATVLHVIMANPDVSHGELAEMLFIQLPNMTKMLKRLEAEGLVDRLASATDRRRVVLSLTPKGRRLVLRYRNAASAHEKMAFASFSAADRKTLIRLVRRALTSLDARKDKAPHSTTPIQHSRIERGKIR